MVWFGFAALGGFIGFLNDARDFFTWQRALITTIIILVIWLVSHLYPTRLRRFTDNHSLQQLHRFLPAPLLGALILIGVAFMLPEPPNTPQEVVVITPTPTSETPTPTPTDPNTSEMPTPTVDDLEQYEQALADYDQAIAPNPEYATAYNNRGNTYYTLEQYEQALADYDQAIALNPEYATAYNNRGLTYRKLEQYEQALADYDQAIALNPEDASTYNNRGNTYYDLEQYEQALTDYQTHLELWPESPAREFAEARIETLEALLGD
ncbi:MAG: tetratricopeptide repeat protein [Candidatus Promineifilaceae bacterium]